MSTYQIPELVPGDVVLLPTSHADETPGPITVSWVRESPDGTVCVGWHSDGRDLVRCLPLHVAALGAKLVSRRGSGRGMPLLA